MSLTKKTTTIAGAAALCATGLGLGATGYAASAQADTANGTVSAMPPTVNITDDATGNQIDGTYQVLLNGTSLGTFNAGQEPDYISQLSTQLAQNPSNTSCAGSPNVLTFKQVGSSNGDTATDAIETICQVAGGWKEDSYTQNTTGNMILDQGVPELYMNDASGGATNAPTDTGTATAPPVTTSDPTSTSSAPSSTSSTSSTTSQPTTSTTSSTSSAPTSTTSSPTTTSTTSTPTSTTSAPSSSTSTSSAPSTSTTSSAPVVTSTSSAPSSSTTSPTNSSSSSSSGSTSSSDSTSPTSSSTSSSSTTSGTSGTSNSTSSAPSSSSSSGTSSSTTKPSGSATSTAGSTGAASSTNNPGTGTTTGGTSAITTGPKVQTDENSSSSLPLIMEIGGGALFAGGSFLGFKSGMFKRSKGKHAR